MLAIRHSTLVGALCLSLISHTLAADLALQGPAVIPEFLERRPSNDILLYTQHQTSISQQQQRHAIVVARDEELSCTSALVLEASGSSGSDYTALDTACGMAFEFEGAEYMVTARRCNSVNDDGGWMKGTPGERVGVLLRNSVMMGSCFFASHEGVTLGCPDGTTVEAWSLVMCEV